MNTRRKICVITGTRAEYGLLKPLLREITRSPRMKLYLVVTGMHLLKAFGSTQKCIRDDGFAIYASINIFKEKQTSLDMSLAIGKGVISFARLFNRLKPDSILLTADRVEMFAAGIAALPMRIPLFHLCGGEKSGGIDDAMRHALTKMSHIHLANTQASKKRIIRLGEEPWRVYNVGTIGVDRKELSMVPDAALIAGELGFDSGKPILVVVQHPVVTEEKYAASQMRATMEAVRKLKEQTVVIYPNNDAGSAGMIQVIEKYRRFSFIRILVNLGRPRFLGLLRAASAMLGNSSSGLIEAPFYGLPVINIGTRQDLRERAANVFDADYDTNAIIALVRKLKKSGFHKIYKNNPYRSLNTERRIAGLLAEIPLDGRLMNKRLTF